MPLAPGFDDPPIESARAFRIAMQAMARPGTIREIAGPATAGLSQATATLLLVLADRTTPVLLAGRATEARDWLTFHTGAPVAERPADAQFAVGAWPDLGPIEAYPAGTPDYPDRSTTLIVELAALSHEEGPRLTGPGIETEASLLLPDAAALARNAARYPLGVDLFLCAGGRVAGLPRSTRIDEAA
jgi:alpha-D-ribose 1-methylphosphonate 5-triphosphate synthase subunit PhnH